MHQLPQVVTAILIAAVSLSVGCSSMFETRGVVLNGDGDPLPTATVCLYDGISPEFDDFQPVSADGKFTVGISTGAGVERFRLVTRCPGFHDDERFVYRNEGETHRIVLSRLPTELRSVGTHILLDEGSVRFVPDTPDDK